MDPQCRAFLDAVKERGSVSKAIEAASSPADANEVTAEATSSGRAPEPAIPYSSAASSSRQIAASSSRATEPAIPATSAASSSRQIEQPVPAEPDVAALIRTAKGTDATTKDQHDDAQWRLQVRELSYASGSVSRKRAAEKREASSGSIATEPARTTRKRPHTTFEEVDLDPLFREAKRQAAEAGASIDETMLENVQQLGHFPQRHTSSQEDLLKRPIDRIWDELQPTTIRYLKALHTQASKIASRNVNADVLVKVRALGRYPLDSSTYREEQKGTIPYRRLLTEEKRKARLRTNSKFVGIL